MADATSVPEGFSLVKLLKSPMTPLYWVKVIMIGLGIAFLLFAGYGIKKAYFSKPPTTNTTTMGNVGTVVQDCSQQVQDAICNWQKINAKTTPWLELRFWRILKVSLGNT